MPSSRSCTCSRRTSRSAASLTASSSLARPSTPTPAPSTASSARRHERLTVERARARGICSPTNRSSTQMYLLAWLICTPNATRTPSTPSTSATDTSCTSRSRATPTASPSSCCTAGPGGGISPKMRQFFDADAYRAILVDQRGAGRSTPHASVEANTTWHLVDDIEKIRKHLGHRAVDGLRRLVGVDPRARLLAGTSRTRHRDGAARHLPAAPVGAVLDVPGRRLPHLSRTCGSSTSSRSRSTNETT